MTILALDVGTSSVKARLFRNGRPWGEISRRQYPTHYNGPRAEIDSDRLAAAVAAAIGDLPNAKKADCAALCVMSPAWVAMDVRGRAITPIVTHQDRRSEAESVRIENRVGRARHLRLAGNRPFPGSISSTTFAWFNRHTAGVMKKADLAGHLNTFLHRRLTGGRVIDTSNASFTGLYLTCTQSGWSDELCAAAGVSRKQLPEIFESDQIAGRVSRAGAADFHLPAGMPVLAGMVDTSAAILLTGSRPGQLFHVCGSTDVLAVVCDKARPHEKLLTRALGIGLRWTSASTLAAGGSSLDWMKREFFRDVSENKFRALLRAHHPSGIRFDPYLAGERSDMLQRQAAFHGLTLASTREQMLSAVVEALADVSAQRLSLLAKAQPRFLPTVYVSGGAAFLARLMRRDWPAVSRRRYVQLSEASLNGLGTIIPREMQSVAS